jgi:GT2 family glycosyltransferase
MSERYTVVIPTHNGRRRLPAVLEGLERQQQAGEFDVVVVDDGSTDGTADWLERRQGTVRPRVVRQRNSGPAAARNRGVAAAETATVAFLGDDTIPLPGWLSAHRRARERHAGNAPLVVVGYTRPHPRIFLTPFLRWINRQGWQFGYDLIDDPADLAFNFFYTSNASLPRRLLEEERFDEGFPFAAWEDTELGYRLKKRGVRIVFAKDAETLHDHPSDLRRFCERQRRAGYCAVVFYQRHPELHEFLGLGAGRLPPRPALWGHLKRLLRARLLEGTAAEMPEVWNEVLHFYYVAGMEQAWRDLTARGTPPPVPQPALEGYPRPVIASRRAP